MTEITRGIILVVRLDSAELAMHAAEAGMRAGFDAVEITFSVPEAENVMNHLNPLGRALGIPIGAGTVLTPEHVDAAAEAGASFIVAPDTYPPVAERARSRGLSYIPGAFTPSEIQAAHRLGADAVKIFPVRAGGPNYLDELRAPLPHIRYVASGGLSASDCRQLLDKGAHAVCAGTGLFSADALAAGDSAALFKQAASFLSVARGSMTTEAQHGSRR